MTAIRMGTDFVDNCNTLFLVMTPSDPTSSTELAHGADSCEAVSFRDSRWKIRWIVFSLAVLLILRAMMFLRTEWRLPLPWWLILIISIIAPQLFMLFLPIITRIPRAPPAITHIKTLLD